MGKDFVWFVVRAQPRREFYAAENIAKQGCEPYVPCVDNGKGGKHPLFPGYIFAKTAGQWRFLTGTYGVSYVVMSGGKAAQVPPAVIASLRASEDKNGLIPIPEEQPEPQFNPGDKIEITEGPFVAYVGIYKGQSAEDRERVLINMLGRATMVELKPEQIRKAS